MMTKVVHDTDIGAGLEISGGKLEAAAGMATDAEVAAAIAAQDAAENAAEETTRLRNAFIKRAQQVLSSESIFEVSPAGFKFYPDPFMTYSSRLLVIGAGEGVNSLESGYLDIAPPVVGDVIKGLGAPDVVVDVNGFIPVPIYGTLYFKLPAPNAPASAVGEWYVSRYNANDYDVPDDFLFICQQLPNNPGGMYQLFDGRKLAQGKNYADTNWIPLAPYYNNGTGDFNRGYQVPRMRRLNNRVYLEGLLNAPSVGFVGALATLPAGCRPNARHIFNAVVQSSSARVDVESSGAVLSVTNAGVQSWISLDGINFGLN